jgi:CubicO group peptidase (beta-lactamase class C family)/glucose/arabinose dehydrogenase
MGDRSQRTELRSVTAPSTALAGIALVLCLVSQGSNPAAAREQAPAPQAWADWVEPDFPFFSSVLDAGRAGPGFPARNLTPRGLILNLGGGYWAAFDTDLLRVAAMWRGNAVTPKALAPGSYLEPDRKTPGGQSPAPEPDGKVWVANGIYPGWQIGARPSTADPREPAPSAEEVGRGPLPESMGRFKAVRQVRHGVVLEYTAGGAEVREWMTVVQASGKASIVRHFEVGPASEPLWLLLGYMTDQGGIGLCDGSDAPIVLESQGSKSESLWSVHVPAHRVPLRFCAALTDAGRAATVAARALPTDRPAPRWPQEVTTTMTASAAKEAFVVDDFALPTENPWRRNVRPGDIQFLRDGTAVVVTLDGDVWFSRGLHEPGGRVRWRRFASGLHEPLTAAIRDEEVYVFDRNGIWRLRDTNGDGEADVHEMFSNAFAQTADMREFPSTLRLAPRGEFVIAKGGQEATTIGKHNGSVLRVSADGRSATVLGYGFRQPQIGVNVHTGLVTASDQQGHYIPTTPLHIVRDRQFYGFLSDKLPREVYPAPIADPLTWIPHAVNASAMSQVWLFGARMGPLSDTLVHIGFNNPELFRVLLNERGSKPQAAVVSITRAFEFPPLNGSVNPADGQLYIAGFQVLGWGTTATRLAGLGRVRYTGAPSMLPREIVPMDKGVLLRFDVPLDAKKAVDPNSYSVTSWHYQRTYRYGSPQLKADGTPGIDRLAPSSAYLSADGRSVFVGLPAMQPVMQMRVGWTLATADGRAFQENAFFTPYELAAFNPQAEGFGDITVDLRPRASTESAAAPASVEEGRRVYERYGCVACHAMEASSVSKLGPTFKGLYGSDRLFSTGVVRVTADDEYIRESILEPSAKVVSGFGRTGMGMPSYAGVLTDAQVDSLILFIKSLGEPQAPNSSAPAAASGVPPDADIRSILIKRIDADKQSLGIVVGIVEPTGRRLVTYGSLAKGDPRPLTGDTVFEIGSVTKVFTALLLADMAQRGEVSLADPIAKFLPADVAVPVRGGRAITLQDLATHTSGLPRMPANFAPKDPSNPYADYGVAPLTQFLSGYTLTRDVGAQYEYSNFGAGLLGTILSRRAGMDYGALVESRITGPLGMKSTSIALTADMKARLAAGHNGRLGPVSNWDFPAGTSALAGAGALRSTANDVLTFIEANLGATKTPLAPAMAALLATRVPTGRPGLEMALGWHITATKAGKEIIWHNGGTGGYRSFVGYDRRAGAGVVVLSNTSTPIGVDDIGVHLLDRNAPLYSPPPPRKETAVDPKLFDGYVGRYQLGPNFILTITREGTQLFAQATGQGRFELYPESERTYFAKVADIAIAFETDDQGRATSLVLQQGGGKVAAKRIE